MPIDPSISLQVNGAQQQKPVNPLEAMGQTMDMAGKMNQLRQFQQTFAARQKAGQIMATSPDAETAFATMQRDPIIMGFAPEMPKQIADNMTALTHYQGAVSKMTGDIWHDFSTQAPLIYSRGPQAWDGIKKTIMANAPNQIVRDRAGKMLDAWHDAVMDGVETDKDGNFTDAGKKHFAQNMVGMATSAGAGESMKYVLKNNTIQDTGPNFQGAQQNPPQGSPDWQGGGAGGAITPTGDVIPKEIPPQLTNDQTVPYPPKGKGGAPAAPAKPAVRMSADGTPLFADDPEAMKPPTSVQLDVSGNPTGQYRQQATDLSKKFQGEERDIFNSALTTESMLTEMGRNIDQMAMGDRFLVPGAFADVRYGLAKSMLAVGQILGVKKLPFKPEDVARGEDVLKLMQRMGISYLTTALGSQREAAETIRNVTEKAIPGIDNTPLGAKLLINSIQSAQQREIERRYFKEEWNARNNGNMIGAEEAFNKRHPAKAYMIKALDDMGMSENGFKSVDDIATARRLGLISAQDARKYGVQQGFFDKDGNLLRKSREPEQPFRGPLKPQEDEEKSL